MQHTEKLSVNKKLLLLTLATTSLYGLFSVATTSDAQAQTVPSAAAPERIEQRFDTTTPKHLEALPQIKQKELIDDDAETISKKTMFVLKYVEFVGNTVFSNDELATLYTDLVGEDVGFSDLQNIANKITNHYRNSNYILSKAVIPPQNVENGKLKIKIIEGYVNKVSFAGQSSGNIKLLRKYAERIKKSVPLDNNILERYLLLMDDVTGMTARTVITPSGDIVGSADLAITISHQKIDAYIGVDNRGSRFLGPLQGNLTVGFNSLFGNSERIQLRTIHSLNFEEMNYYDVSYLQPFGSSGGSWQVSASNVDTKAGGNLEAFDVLGESQAISLEVKHPFLRSRQSNLFGYANFKYRNSTSEILNTQVYEDRVRSFSVGFDYDNLDWLDGVNRVNAEVTQGVNLFNENHSGDTLSRANGDRNFTKISTGYSRIQPLNKNFSIFGAVSGQYAFDPLLSSEEFGVGGLYGSAYDPSEIAGDHGFAARSELRYTHNLPEKFGNICQLYGFYDGGVVWNKNLIIGENRRESLTSAGIGTRLDLSNKLQVNLEIAAPLTRPVAAEGSDGDDIRAFFNISKKF